MHIGYFVHDTHDAAVHRRVRMLQAGGAQVTVLGFRRSDEKLRELSGARVIDFGRTYDGRLLARIRSVLSTWLRTRQWLPYVAEADVLMARNLEMLVLAARARRRTEARLIYEALDIHRSLLGPGLTAKLLRRLERMRMARANLLIVSSTAFLRSYFKPMQGWAGPTLLVENKVFEPTPMVEYARPAKLSPLPWRIGWFGVIRCAKSLDLLSKIASASNGKVEVVIRGRPARHEFDDFDRQVAQAAGVSYEGPYRTSELGNIYGQVHFAWAIDYFEEGLNSSWLLPNRLYEGPRWGVVPISLTYVETGRWLAERGAGILLADPASELGPFLANLTAAGYAGLRDAVAKIPVNDLVADQTACAQLVAAIGQDG